MGNTSAIAREDNQEMSFGDVGEISDYVFHRNHMETYGCGEKYQQALLQCRPFYQDVPDADACAKATAALRLCMEADPAHFQAYVRAMDKGLDQDERRAVDGKPPLPAWDFKTCRFRWWAGMKRT
jgi:hypothetical protein